ncbi:DSBA oxidoreductase [Polynucleobacter sp. TUM22923]|jgi:2-hydroxychromene-2-carboxylate isomerase|uniref:2-hydroxychromene-2-carboxylate isomerase n=1 Tax=Polynucleobacter sp. TUM22923 TaxID=3022126 RepID=UPI002572517D|nr:DsbA family protein [Polynucleobacter sp. TUM22923]BDX21589.1 DSBA oxidoreductase [Polynucleobacter sp. TUM22923]
MMPTKDVNEIIKAVFYYDIISPYTYLYIHQRRRLEERLAIEPIPILLGGLLRATDNRGPGEVAAKRPHTYQHCIWLAEKLGIPLQFPEHHPFQTVAAQRLLTQLGANWSMVEKAFEYVWVLGKDPNLSWPEFCEHLGIDFATPKPDSPQIKAQLMANTEQARCNGAFGVPALVFNGHCFWGLDTIDWALEYLNRPNMFQEPAYQSVCNIPSGL